MELNKIKTCTHNYATIIILESCILESILIQYYRSIYVPVKLTITGLLGFPMMGESLLLHTITSTAREQSMIADPNIVKLKQDTTVSLVVFRQFPQLFDKTLYEIDGQVLFV